MLCTNNVAQTKAQWLTALSTQCGEGFHLAQHSTFMFLKHIMDHLSQSLYRGHLATSWSFSVFCNYVAFYHQSVCCFLQVAWLTDSRINLPIRPQVCWEQLGSSWQESKVGLDEKWTWDKHKMKITVHSVGGLRNRDRHQGHTMPSQQLQAFRVSSQACTVRISPEGKPSIVIHFMGKQSKMT